VTLTLAVAIPQIIDDGSIDVSPVDGAILGLFGGMSSVKVFQICFTREFNNWNIICETRSSEGEGEDARWQAAAGGAAGEVRCSRDHARNSRKAIVRDGFKKWKLCAPHRELE
jgi:hypothetical protein